MNDNFIFFETLDIDYFFIDINENISHVASDGGLPPSSIVNYFDNYFQIENFMESLPNISEEVIINEKLENFRFFENENKKEMYLNSFISFAKKGLFSFDKSNLQNLSNTTYHLVASPKIKYNFNSMPLEIKNILNKSIYQNDVSNAQTINTSDIT